MNRRIDKRDRKVEFKRWIIGMLVVILGGVIAAIGPKILDMTVTYNHALVMAPQISSSPYLISKTFGHVPSIEVNGIQTEVFGGYLSRFTLFEVNNKVDCYDSIDTGIQFNVHNKNDFSIPIQNVYVDVTSYAPFDSYLKIFWDSGAGEGLQTYVCSIKPKVGRYIARYSPDDYEEKNTDMMYLKVDPKDSEEVYIILEAETEGLYGVRVTIEYSLQGEIRTVSTDYDLYYTKDPISPDYANCSFYYSFGHKEDGYYDAFYKDFCPNFITNTDEIDRFLEAHYRHPELYSPVIKDWLSYFSGEE